MQHTNTHPVRLRIYRVKPPLARLIQNGFTGEVKAGETRKTGFSRLLVHFNSGLQNDFTLQCLNLCKIDEAEAGVNRAKEARSMYTNMFHDTYLCLRACIQQHPTQRVVIF